MKNIPERVEKEIIQLAKQYDIQKVILFGSRARGDNWERSDIDLAVSGGDIPGLPWIWMKRSGRCCCLTW